MLQKILLEIIFNLSCTLALKSLKTRFSGKATENSFALKVALTPKAMDLHLKYDGNYYFDYVGIDTCS